MKTTTTTKHLAWKMMECIDRVQCCSAKMASISGCCAAEYCRENRVVVVEEETAC